MSAKHSRSDDSIDVATEDVTVEVTPFEGQPPVRVSLLDPSPFGWWPALLLAFVGMVDRLDASMVGGVLTKLQAEFGFSDFVAGFLFSAPAIAAALLVIPAGVLADRGRRTRLLTVVILTWSVLTLGSGLAPTLMVFFILRTMLGAAAPLNIPIVGSLIGDYYPPSGRSRAFGIIRVIEYLGFPLGIAVGAILGGAFGWRSAFYVAAIPGLIIAAFVFFKLREPQRGLGDSLGAQRAAMDAASVDVASSPAPTAIVEVSDVRSVGRFRELLSQVWAIRTVRILVVAQALLYCAFSGMFSFSAAFFERTNGLTAAQGGAIAGSVGLVGILVGGAFAAFLGDSPRGRTGWRIRLSSGALLIASVLVLVLAAIPILAIEIVVFAAINTVSLIAIVNLGAATADVVPARIRGSGFSVLQFLITFGSAAGPLIVGGISALAGQNLRWSYAAMVVPFAVGALFLRRGIEPYEMDARAVLDEIEAAH